MNLIGILVGASALVIIAVSHPIVIKTEYYFGSRVWPAFLVVGLASIGVSLLVDSVLVASIFGIAGFSALWGIQELREQMERVERGWFPKNPRR